jgi:hypothetical protein
MKSLVTLLDSIIAESGDICSVDTLMDIKTVHKRFTDKGLAFLTRDLPTYEAGLLTSLASGYVVPDAFPLWKKHKRSPVFLGGFMDLIFDRETGLVLDIPSSDAIRCVRQISLLYKKIELECSPSITAMAFDRYVECDRGVKEFDDGIRNGSIPTDDFSRLASLVFSSVFRKADLAIRDFLLVPKHGPGATADGKVANAKFLFDTWSDRCEAVFPFWWYAGFGQYSTERYSQVNFLEPGSEMPVKVIAVPKTQDTPRIIAMEPSYVQYLQQGVNTAIKQAIDNSMLYDFISTEYQEPNQLLAHVGSLDGSLATLDLSEASDRVPLALVEKLFAGHPHLLDAVLATRSTQALVPGHGVIPLAKFASMGSALCFPVEVMVFFILILIGYERANDTRISSLSALRRLSGQVRAYGDDLIVPTGIAVSVVEALELFGFKVNTSKSFWTGKFRESCGKEFYGGDDVSIVRFRRELPLSRKNVSEMVSLVSFRNQLYKAGYWRTVKELDEEIESLIPFPAVSDRSEVLGRHSFLPISGERVGGRYQRPLVRGAVVKFRRRSSQINDEAALMKCLSFREAGDPYGPLNPLETEPDHLLMGGRPNASSINIRWAPAD